MTVLFFRFIDLFRGAPDIVEGPIYPLFLKVKR